MNLPDKVFIQAMDDGTLQVSMARYTDLQYEYIRPHGWHDAIKDPPKESWMYIVRIGKRIYPTLSVYFVEGNVWGEDGVTYWMDYPPLPESTMEDK